MGIHDSVSLSSTAYTLVYDSTSTGFYGSIQSIGGVNCVVRIDSSLPDPTDSGFILSSQNPVDVVVTGGEKLYARGQYSDADVILIDNSAIDPDSPLSVSTSQLPATLGAKTSANSLSVTPATDAITTVAYTSSTQTSRSNTITTGGTAQTLMAANSLRKGWWLQNLSTGDLWVNRFGGTASAAQPNIQIPSGALYETPAGGAGSTIVSIYGATTGQSFASGEW